MYYPGVQAVIDLLEDEEAMGFNMEYPFDFNKCGSPCCIGGHCQALLYREGDPSPTMLRSFIKVAQLPEDEINQSLESWAVAEAVCYIRDLAAGSLNQRHNSVAYRDVQKHQAIRMLEHLRDTGEVDWERAMGTAAE